MHKIIQSTVQSTLLVGLFAVPANAFNLAPIGTYATGLFDESAAEIAAYDPVTQRLFVSNDATNQIDVLNISDPTNPSLLFNINLDNDVNSVAFQSGILAAAVEGLTPQDPGSILFFDANGALTNSITVGALPDAMTFTPNGNQLLVANQGAANDAFDIDPEGSVSIIDLSGGVANASVKTAGFKQFNNAPLDPDVRIFGPGASVAQDLEPEFIAVAEDSRTAWVTLQENNALGILDLTTGEFTDIVALGFKDHSEEDNGLDASDRDDAINIATYENLFGIYNPDAIAAYTFGDETFLVTANEGNARDFEGFNEEERIADLLLDPDAFPNAAELQADEVLGRLEVTTTLGDPDNDGDFDQLFAFGGRSFSIWDEAGNLVFDSGDDFEQITARLLPEFFNSNNDENSFDNRSDNKGPEPEGITIGQFGDRTVAFVGLERIGGIISYDVSDPFNPFFLDYTNNRDFFGDPETGSAGDLGPEGVFFISGQDSPSSNPLLVVTNEVSGTTTIYSVTVPEPTSIFGLLTLGTLGLWGIKRKQSN